MAETCSGCGHTITARCSRCGREMLCGKVAVPCPEPQCLEGVLADPDDDLTHGPIEDPRGWES